ncbi:MULTISPECIES: shufflon system plasmid conjugative transfer pilus tip adhesin PilV [unclassified Paraburkholderia]|uniref:shufflon system plasmid conjugative transfer pilus tip adhesin PilV n=1 Tax=unclassified Paraburkholderia TaxID=2615204 RepID=UPI002AB1F277|nr:MULTISPECIES: shufflon system plasmid conjugative transfer pilus tip adhesin PilV [unclassified Paraburkholderia]
MNKRIARHARAARQRGFTMIEMLVALALAAIMIAGFAAMLNDTLDDTRAQQAALYQQQMTQAATQLVRQNYAALAAAATTATPVVIGLKNTPYVLSSWLPDGVGATNPYGQTPCLLVYASPTTAGALQALLVTEGGTEISDAQLGYIAANSGAGGGEIQSNGRALGAYGAWSVAAPNPGGQSCSGTKTGKGHLASLVAYNGSQAQNSDYLYRVAVPGNSQANAMQVPIVLAQMQTAWQQCGTVGAVAANPDGEVLNCLDGTWEPQASYHWRGTAPDEAALASIANPVQGDVMMTKFTNRAYTFNGTAWQALAVDESGKLELGNAQTVGAACVPASASSTSVTTDANGRVLSCRNGTWQTQSEIEPADSVTGCEKVLVSPGATDYDCAGPAAAYTHNATNGTYSYTVTQAVHLSKPGMIVASTWAHLNDGTCTTLQNPPQARAQVSQSVDITDSGGVSISHTESQGPTLVNDSGGINNSLTQAEPVGDYNVVVTTNWATYDVITTPWTSSFCGESGQTIPNTPVAAGWSINTYY